MNLSSSPTAINTSQFDNCQSFCCHVCPENKISDFWRRSTNYCFSAFPKRSTLSKYNYYNNYYKLLLFCNVVMFAPKTKFPSFGAALPFPSTIYKLLLFSSVCQYLKLDNCQSFCCHVCPENKVSEFWRRSTLSKYNYYKLLLFCNFKKNV